MAKSLLICLLVLGSSTLVFSQELPRNVRWDMPKKEVKRQEKANLMDEDRTYLHYMGQIRNQKTAILYRFQKRKLVGMSYTFLETYRGSKYYEARNKLKDHIKDQFGFPSHTKHNGATVIWRYQDTKITLVTRRKGSEYRLGVIYQYLRKEKEKAQNRRSIFDFLN